MLFSLSSPLVDHGRAPRLLNAAAATPSDAVDYLGQEREKRFAALFAAPILSARLSSSHVFQTIAALRANPAPFDGAGTCTSLFSADLVDDDDGAIIVSSRTPPFCALHASTAMRWTAI